MIGEGQNRVDWEVPPCLMRGGLGGTTMFGEGWIGRYRHVWRGAGQGGLGGTAMFGEGWIGRYRHVWRGVEQGRTGL